MRRVLKYIFLLIVIIGVGFGVYKGYLYHNNKGDLSLTTDINKFNENLATEVTREDMVSTLSFVGNTKIKNQQKLKFNYESRVTGVFFKAGDEVKEGDLIAELDKSEIYSQVEIYKLGVQNAELKLKKLLENTAEIEVNKAKIALDKQKQDFDNAKANLEFFRKEQKNKIDEMEKNLRLKETEYRILQAETKINLSQINSSSSEKEQELLKSKNSLATSTHEYERDLRDFDLNYSKKEQEYYTTIEKEYLSIEETERSLTKFFNDMDVLFKILPHSVYNSTYMTYFSAKNTNYRNVATDYIQRAYGKYKVFVDKVSTIKNREDIGFLVDMVDVQLEMYKNLSIASENIMKGLDESVESEDFDSSKISGFYGIASSMYSTSNSKLIDLKKIPLDLKTLKKPDEIKKDMDNDLRTKKDQLEDLKISIKKLEDSLGMTNDTVDDKIVQETKKLDDKKIEIENYKLELEKTKLNNEYELDSKIKSIKQTEIDILVSEKNLKDLLDDDSNQDLIFAQNDLKQAKISLENEVKKLESYELRAPFVGIITKLDYQVGDNLVQNDEKYILLENPNILEISIFADQVDVMKLSKGQRSLVSYDAFPGVEFEAKIIEIDSTPQDKEGVTKYEVKLFLEKPEQTIFSGMTAQVNVVAQEKEGVLAVPFSAINTNPETGETYVVVLNDKGNKEERVVSTGYSDGINTEIIEGLEEGEKVLQIDYDANYYKPEDFGVDQGFYY